MTGKKNRTGWFFLLISICVVFFAGCGIGSSSKNVTSQASPGFRDGVGSFLFNFDNSSQTQKLARDIKRGVVPSRVTWYYEKGGTARDGEGELGDNSRSSTDPEKIMEIFNALSNTVIMGGAPDQSAFTHYFISFTLQDGSECRFDFVSESVIRFGGQNYVVETAIDLWDKAGDGAESDTVRMENDTESSDRESDENPDDAEIDSVETGDRQTDAGAWYCLMNG